MRYWKNKDRKEKCSQKKCWMGTWRGSQKDERGANEEDSRKEREKESNSAEKNKKKEHWCRECEKGKVWGEEKNKNEKKRKM